MGTSWFLVAYFGPEMQLPLASLLGAVSGLLMLVGRAPVRLVRRWFQAVARKPVPVAGAASRSAQDGQAA